MHRSGEKGILPKDGFTYKTYLVNKSDAKNTNSKSNIVSSEIYPQALCGRVFNRFSISGHPEQQLQ